MRVFSLVLLGLLTPLCHGQELASPFELGFASELGIPGAYGLIDAEPVVEGLVGRGGLRWGFVREKIRLSGRVEARLRTDRHEAQLVGGISAPPLDVGGRVSWRFLESEQATGEADSVDGRGDVELAARLTIPWLLDEYVCLAPFAIVRIPTARREVERPAAGEIGLALAVPPGTILRALSSGVGQPVQVCVNLIANLVGRQEEYGQSSFVYRLGVGLTLVMRGDFAARFYGYAEGLEPEGHPTSQVDLVAGLQLSFWEQFGLDLGVAWGVVDGGLRPQDLRRLQAELGSTERHVDTQRLAATVGLNLTF